MSNDSNPKVEESNTQSARAALEDGVAKIKSAASTARGKAQELAGEAKERYGRASEVAKERYEKLSEKAREGYTRARKDIDDLTENVNEYVRDNPGKAVLIAAGLGFVVGLLVRSRRVED